MRVLLAHNHYGSAAPSGENRVFALERDMLLRYGHEVETFEVHSDSVRTRGKTGLFLGAMSTPWNPKAARAIRAKVAAFKPEIFHVHNTFPLLSPSIFSAAAPAARVLTLHNYRLQCAAAIPVREGNVCTLCIDRRNAISSVKYGCYRDSRAATFPLALSITLHRARGTWRKDVERFIALSEFQRDLMARGGLPSDRIAVKPNFYPGRPERIAFSDRPYQVLFVGRLSSEKGIGDLIEAWRLWGTDAPGLRVVGDGPLRSQLEEAAGQLPKVHIVGPLASAQAEAEIGNAKLLVVPSRWFEGFPMVLREAFAYGTASAVSEIGPLPAIVEAANGATFPPGNPQAMLERLRSLWETQEQLASMSLASARAFEMRYAEPQNHDQLMDIYSRAIATVLDRAR